MRDSRKRIDLVLIGASGVAHEMIDTVHDLPNDWNLVGILDDDKSKTGEIFYRETRILGTSDEISKMDLRKTRFLVTFSSPASFLKREAYVVTLQKQYPEIHFATLIHPNGYVSKTARFGVGVYCSPGVILDSNSVLGNHVIVLFHSVISRYVTVGDYSFVSATVNIVGNRSIGKSVYLGAKATINANIDDCTLVDSATLVRKTAPQFSIVSLKSDSSDAINFNSREKMQRLLQRRG